MDNIGPPTVTSVINACIAIAAWTANYKYEIKQLYKKGIRNAQKIVEILTKRHKK